jgi:hypothetical protein
MRSHLTVRPFLSCDTTTNDALTSFTLASSNVLTWLKASKTVTLLPLHSTTTPLIDPSPSRLHSTRDFALNLGGAEAAAVFTTAAKYLRNSVSNYRA